MLLLALLSVTYSHWISYQYRNQSDNLCGDIAPHSDLYFPGGKVLQHTYRDFFFPEGVVWGTNEIGYYKVYSRLKEGSGYFTHIENCTDLVGLDCVNVTVSDEFPCYSRYSFENRRSNPTHCFKYEYPCMNSNNRGDYIYARSKRFSSLDTIPDYFYKWMFLTVWDGDPNCGNLDKSKIMVGRNYKSWVFNDTVTDTRLYFGIPQDWMWILRAYDGDTPSCVDQLNLQYRCHANRLYVDTFYSPPGYRLGCGGTLNGTYSMEEFLYGKSPTCSFEKQKFVCGKPPFTFLPPVSTTSGSISWSVMSSIFLTCLLGLIF